MKIKTALFILPFLGIVSSAVFAETAVFDTLPYNIKKEITTKTKGGDVQSINRTVEGSNKAVYEVKSLHVGVLSTFKVEDNNWVNNVATPPTPVLQAQPEVKKEEPKQAAEQKEAMPEPVQNTAPVVTEIKAEEAVKIEPKAEKEASKPEDKQGEEKIEDDAAEDEFFRIEPPTGEDLND